MGRARHVHARPLDPGGPPGHRISRPGAGRHRHGRLRDDDPRLLHAGERLPPPDRARVEKRALFRHPAAVQRLRVRPAARRRARAVGPGAERPAGRRRSALGVHAVPRRQLGQARRRDRHAYPAGRMGLQHADPPPLGALRRRRRGGRRPGLRRRGPRRPRPSHRRGRRRLRAPVHPGPRHAQPPVHRRGAARAQRAVAADGRALRLQDGDDEDGRGDAADPRAQRGASRRPVARPHAPGQPAHQRVRPETAWPARQQGHPQHPEIRQHDGGHHPAPVGRGGTHRPDHSPATWC